MANKVSFIIQLQDKFSRAAKAVNAKLKSFSKNSLDAGSAANKLSQAEGVLVSKSKKLIGSTRRLRKANKALIPKVDGLNKKIKKTGKSVNKTSDAFDDLKTRAKNAIGAVVAAFGVKEFIRIGSEFQDALADLSSITGASGKELQFLSDESLRLAKVMAVTQSEVATAFTTIASAKSELLKDPKGLSIVTEQALLLANAAGISVPEAVQASVGALNQFNQGADQAARFVNVIAASAKVGASRVEETAEALKNAGTVAAQFNVSFEQVNALLQVLAKNGVKGAEAGTALRGTLSKLEKFMGGRLAPSRIGIIQSLEMIEKLGLSNTQVIKEFGEENLRSILILRQNTPLLKRWTKELTNTNVAQEQADVRLATFNSKIRKLGVSINDKIIKTFLRLEPILTKQTVRFGEFLDSIDERKIDAFGESLKRMLKLLELLADAAGVVADAFTTIGTGLGETVAKLNVLEGSKLQKELLKPVEFKLLPGTLDQDIINTFKGLFGGEDIQVKTANDFIKGEEIGIRTTNEMMRSVENRIDGEITVKAEPGTKVTETEIIKRGSNLNVGFNMEPAT